MINVDKFKTFVYLVARKNGRGTLTPSQFDSAAERGLFAWTANQVSNQKQYTPGSPVPATSLDLDSIAMAKVRHLKETRVIRAIDGQVKIPNGVEVDVNSDIMPEMWMHSGLTHKFAKNGVLNEKDIDIVKDMQWGLTVNSNIVAPTQKRAIGNFHSDYIRIEPKALISLVTLTYVRNPTTPIWGYTTVNGRPVYDAASSTDIDAPESAMNEIAMIVLEFLGISIRDTDLVSAAVGMEKKGI
tara:strand:+ start:4021 stop:4746 length:726 start_codon:yes stop_codon:yes gene_type:complete